MWQMIELRVQETSPWSMAAGVNADIRSVDDGSLPKKKLDNRSYIGILTTAEHRAVTMYQSSSPCTFVIHHVTATPSKEARCALALSSPSGKGTGIC
jgi:hypothetical protein